MDLSSPLFVTLSGIKTWKNTRKSRNPKKYLNVFQSLCDTHWACFPSKDKKKRLYSTLRAKLKKWRTIKSVTVVNLVFQSVINRRMNSKLGQCCRKRLDLETKITPAVCKPKHPSAESQFLLLWQSARCLRTTRLRFFFFYLKSIKPSDRLSTAWRHKQSALAAAIRGGISIKRASC